MGYDRNHGWTERHLSQRHGYYQYLSSYDQGKLSKHGKR